MNMEDKNYMDFLDTVGTNRVFVEELNNFLLDNNCEREVKTAKSGFVVSYILKETKRTLANFVCRKTGIKIRIYPQNLSKYECFLDTLPVKMKKEIIKASICKRLVDPNDCNPKCIMGYDFTMDNERYQKCRYMAFILTITEESYPFIKEFIKKELS